MIETQASINEWALATFGPSDHRHMLARAIQECSELLMEITKSEFSPVKVAEECADIIGPLCRVAEFVNMDLTPLFSANDFLAANQLYGPALGVMSRLVFLMERMAPYNQMRNDEAAKQIGRIVIGLAEICESVGENLGDHIQKKMIILRSRRWILDGHGAGQHIKDDFVSPNEMRHRELWDITNCALGGTCQPGECARRPECDNA